MFDGLHSAPQGAVLAYCSTPAVTDSQDQGKRKAANSAAALAAVPALPLEDCKRGKTMTRLMRNLPIEFVIFCDGESKLVRRMARKPEDSGRASAFEKAQLKWEADIARRKMERTNPDDVVNLATGRILGNRKMQKDTK